AISRSRRLTIFNGRTQGTAASAHLRWSLTQVRSIRNEPASAEFRGDPAARSSGALIGARPQGRSPDTGQDRPATQDDDGAAGPQDCYRRPWPSSRLCSSVVSVWISRVSCVLVLSSSSSSLKS